LRPSQRDGAAMKQHKQPNFLRFLKLWDYNVFMTSFALLFTLSAIGISETNLLR
jgi:hypothetical protein